MVSKDLLPTSSPAPRTPADDTRPSSPKLDEVSNSPKLARQDGMITRIRKELAREVDNKQTDAVSIYACLLTGFTAAISFSVSHL